MQGVDWRTRKFANPPERKPMKRSKLYLLPACLWFAFGAALGDDLLRTHKVTDKVYAIVGDLGNRSIENLGNNATFGFVLTDEGVVLIDAGATLRGAQAIEAQIRKITEKPVRIVINTGGQDHRWLGNDYFRRKGARVIASGAAVEDQRARMRDQFIQLDNLVGKERLQGTEPAYADETFDEALDLGFGGMRFELRYPGPAHTPGDIFIWLPDEQVMFTGDIVYIERMLAVGAQSHSRQWIEAFDAMATYEPRHIVPGHGHPTTIEQAKRDTRDYLVFLRETVAEFIDQGSDLSEIGTIDQSAFQYLRNFDLLSGRNAHRVFTELEWE